MRKKRKASKANTKPERDLVERPCLDLMRRLGWEVEISKAERTFNHMAGRFFKSHLEPGMTDVRGWDSNDRPFYVEFKAPGRLSDVWGTPRKPNYRRQVEFLLKQIRRNCFAVVVDSHESLYRCWKLWSVYQARGQVEDAKTYLRSLIPDEPKRRGRAK